MLGIILSPIELELYFTGDGITQYMFTPVQTILRLIISISTLALSNEFNNKIVLVFFNSLMYVKQYEYLRSKSFHKSLGRSFWQSKHFKMLLFTNLINLIHAPPYFEYQFIMKTLSF